MLTLCLPSSLYGARSAFRYPAPLKVTPASDELRTTLATALPVRVPRRTFSASDNGAFPKLQPRQWDRLSTNHVNLSQVDLA